MKNRSKYIWLFCFVLLAARTQAQSVAVIINNDPTELHLGNVSSASKAIRHLGIKNIIALGNESKIPSQKDVTEAFQQIANSNGQLKILYITGHGTLIYNKKNPDGIPAIMLRDRPLYLSDITPFLGSGPCLVYIDICYAPSWIEKWNQTLQGDFLILTDKNPSKPLSSCRGISSKFWQIIERADENIPLFSLAQKAWRESCPDGQCMHK